MDFDDARRDMQQSYIAAEAKALDRQVQIDGIRKKIFELAKTSPDIEVLSWYVSLDECFENNEFHKENFANLRWRCFVLRQKQGFRVTGLLNDITRLMQSYGLLDAFGREVNQQK